jgi:hypothetical protein
LHGRGPFRLSNCGIDFLRSLRRPQSGRRLGRLDLAGDGDNHAP